MYSQEESTIKLLVAAHDCDENEVRRLIQNGVEVNASTNNGMTALHVASQVGNAFEILQSLLTAGADVNAMTDDGITALHLAVMSNRDDNVEFLLEHNADVNCRDKLYRFTPLHLAAYTGHIATISMLLSRGARVDETARDDVTPLHLASIKGCLLTAEILVKHGASITHRTKSGQYTMLHLSLMDSVGDLNKIMNLAGEESELSRSLKSIPLIDIRKRAHLLEYMVAQGINANATDVFGRTALHFAACNNFNLLVGWILKLGVNSDLKDNSGHLAFHYTLINDNSRGLWDLLQSGTDVNDIYVLKSRMPEIIKDKYVANTLKMYLVKMVALNLPIADTYKPYVKVRDYYVLHRSCQKEVAALRDCYIDLRTTVYDMLHMTPKVRRKFISNRQLEFQQFKYIAPMYRGVVEASFREIGYWKELVRLALPRFQKIVGFPLPDLCVEIIFGFLDSCTLRTIIHMVE